VVDVLKSLEKVLGTRFVSVGQGTAILSLH
jgi:hypothetical protein